ncbi:MAG TPA: type VI secretion system contractile sheath small subunit [Candidatus Binatia bacterium]|nr:type VI secretion system contractile sheath small subunit [Candidatus Binatia bacterium]
MAKSSSQKFIQRNRPPRVQIQYETETYGAREKTELPFVMGVMSNLAGDNAEALPEVDDRKMLDIDMDNFNDRMRALAPSLKTTVPNKLTGQGQLAIELKFKSMEDFSPGAIARQVEPLRKLLEARQQLANLATYMDGKAGAENLISKLLNDPALLSALSKQAKPGDGSN